MKNWIIMSCGEQKTCWGFLHIKNCATKYVLSVSEQLKDWLIRKFRVIHLVFNWLFLIFIIKSLMFDLWRRMSLKINKWSVKETRQAFKFSIAPYRDRLIFDCLKKSEMLFALKRQRLKICFATFQIFCHLPHERECNRNFIFLRLDWTLNFTA